jgi:hypothetical protein
MLGGELSELCFKAAALLRGDVSGGGQEQQRCHREP